MRDWIASGASQIAMTDVAWTGGIAGAKRLASMAEAFGLPLVLHNAGGPISHAANLHVAANIPNLFEMETVRAFYRTASVNSPISTCRSKTVTPPRPQTAPAWASISTPTCGSDDLRAGERGEAKPWACARWAIAGASPTSGCNSYLGTLPSCSS
ncbi:MAG: enolase C-terminal domain-like protein [Caldilineaceae bacterium]